MSFIWPLSSASLEEGEDVSALLPFPVMTFAIFNVDDFLPESESDSDDSDDSSLRLRNIWGFFSSRSLKTREKSISFDQLVSVCIFFEGSVFTFQLLNEKIHD